MNDRDYKAGDTFDLCEVVGGSAMRSSGLSGRQIGPFVITFVFQGGQYGVQDDHCVFGFEPVKPQAKTVIDWIPVGERLPEPDPRVMETQGVLVCGKAGKHEWFSIGYYVHPMTVEMNDGEFSDNMDYDEAKDQYFCKPGWYEPIPEVVADGMDYSHEFIHLAVTHWAVIEGPEEAE